MSCEMGPCRFRIRVEGSQLCNPPLDDLNRVSRSYLIAGPKCQTSQGEKECVIGQALLRKIR